MRQDQSMITAKIFTEHHQYEGTVLTRGYRLADLLNDPSTEVLEMHSVHVSQMTNTRSKRMDCAQLLVKKDAIELAIPTGGYEAPARRIYSYVEKKRYLAQIVLPGYTLTGTIHLPSRGSSWIWLSEGSTEPSFVPVTDVTIHFATPDLDSIHTKVIIFRRRFIESMFLSEKAITAESLIESARQLRDPDAADLAARVVEELREPELTEDPVSIPINLDTGFQPSRPA